MRRLLPFLLLLLAAVPAWAQQDPMYSTYLANKLVLNPAYAGSREALAIALQGRRQWVGATGAPKTELLSAHMATPDGHHGFGLSLVNDRWGATQNFLFAGSYAYRIPIGEEGHLALGLKAGFKSFRVQYSGVPLWDAGDNAFNGGNNYSKIQAVVAPGIYFQNKLFYAGLSVGDMLPHQIYASTAGTAAAKTATHVFGMAGMAIPLGESLKLKPSVLIRAVGGAPLGADLTLALAYKERVSAGLTLRPSNAIAFQVQAYLSKSIQLGYAYDLGLRGTRDFASGGHELMLGFDIRSKSSDIDAPKSF